jgi:hypothetical protein
MICKIFTVVKLHIVVIRTMTFHNKRSALKKKVMCFLETLVNKHQTTRCGSLEKHNKSIPLLSFAIHHCDSANHWSLYWCRLKAYFCKVDPAVSGIEYSKNFFFYLQKTFTNRGLQSCAIFFSYQFQLRVELNFIYFYNKINQMHNISNFILF